MKTTLGLVMAACLCIGCGRSSSTSKGGPDGPGNLGGPLATVSTPTAAGGTIIEFEVNPIRVEKGKTATVAVIAKRKNANAAPADTKKGTGRDSEMYKESYFQGDITLEFDGSDAGLKIAPVTIPAGQEKAEATVTANADAAGGFVEVTGKGTGAQKIEPVTIRIRADVH